MTQHDEHKAIIITPEHVPIQLVTAGLASRFLAILLDSLIVIAISAMIHLILYLLAPFGLKEAIAIAIIFLLQWSYHIYFDVKKGGQTPGKHLCGLRVVDSRGLPITFQQSLVRNVVRVLDFAPIFYGLGGLVSLFDRNHRRLGDIVADTLVIQEREAVDYSRQLADPRRFNTLKTPQITRKIRHRVTLEEREFLLALCLRASKMETKARFDIMDRVGIYYRAKLEIDDSYVSNENIVRDLTHILWTEKL